MFFPKQRVLPVPNNVTIFQVPTFNIDSTIVSQLDVVGPVWGLWEKSARLPSPGMLKCFVEGLHPLTFQ